MTPTRILASELRLGDRIPLFHSATSLTDYALVVELNGEWVGTTEGQSGFFPWNTFVTVLR